MFLKREKKKNRKEQNVLSTFSNKINEAIGGKKSVGIGDDDEISCDEDDKGTRFVV